MSSFLRCAGAVKTVIQMLGTEQKRAAAVTMLGKTVERCADQVRPPGAASVCEGLPAAPVGHG